MCKPGSTKQILGPQEHLLCFTNNSTVKCLPVKMCFDTEPKRDQTSVGQIAARLSLECY